LKKFPNFEKKTKQILAQILLAVKNVCLLFVFLALQPIVVVFSQPSRGL